MELPSFHRTFLWNILRYASSAKSSAGQRLMREKERAIQGVGRTLWLGALLLLPTESVQAQVYTVTQLKQDIASFLASEYRQMDHERIDINVSNLDNRLRLANCLQPVEFINRDPSGMGGNISVKAACTSGTTWSVHVPAQVTIYRAIPIAVRDIARGEVISNAHIISSVVDISNIRQTFLPDSPAIVGKEAKRNIGKGEPFKTAALDSPTAVKRGELVTLESLVGSIKVSSAGTAMADGRVGQKIRVRNNSSERIISGVVISQGLVQAL